MKRRRPSLACLDPSEERLWSPWRTTALWVNRQSQRDGGRRGGWLRRAVRKSQQTEHPRPKTKSQGMEMPSVLVSVSLFFILFCF